jgi:hypothetical protein
MLEVDMTVTVSFLQSLPVNWFLVAVRHFNQSTELNRIIDIIIIIIIIIITDMFIILNRGITVKESVH